VNSLTVGEIDVEALSRVKAARDEIDPWFFDKFTFALRRRHG